MADRRQELEASYREQFNIEVLPHELEWAMDKAEEFWSDAWFGTLKEARSVVEWEFAMQWDASVDGWMEMR